ncbi:MAG: DUF4352 domain-containing protein [Micromonosporaceae bacterium]
MPSRNSRQQRKPRWSANHPYGPRPKNRSGLAIGIVIAALAVMVGVFVAGVVLVGTNHDGPRTAHLGKPVRDGGFEFVVSDVACGETRVGNILSAPANGQFCIVNLSVRNVGDEAARFYDNDQRAIDSAGRSHQLDPAAGASANGDAEPFTGAIDPGEKLQGSIVFDIPEDAELVELRLRASGLGSGVTVKLRAGATRGTASDKPHQPDQSAPPSRDNG